MAGIQPEQESHILPSGPPHPVASNSEPNPPSTPLSTIPALTPDKTPATSCNLLSWFCHPLATFTASLKRRRCASFGDNPKAGRKKKAQILGDACTDDEASEAKALQEKKKAPGSSTSDPELLADSVPKAIGVTTAAHIVDCLNDDDVYVKKEDMAIEGKEEKAKAKEQQGSPENVVEKKWAGEPIDITGANNHKVAITSPNKLPESAPITNEEAAAARLVTTAGGLGLRCWEMNQQLAAGIQDATENAEEAAAPATQDTAVTAVSGIREIK
ncbi:uncharacterized protein [Miscanthus floridulus]|uniref:uncharacterized protein n=1 Tax=Miscanthus floridulus TaxID=154761 RepID=UPI00345A545A